MAEHYTSYTSYTSLWSLVCDCQRVFGVKCEQMLLASALVLVVANSILTKY